MKIYVVTFPPYSENPYAECYRNNPVYNHNITVNCPICGSSVSDSYWTYPRCLTITNSRYADFLYWGPSPFVVSTRFKELYEKSDLKGITAFEPIDSFKVQKLKKGNSMPEAYYVPVLCRSRIKIDREKSKITYLDDDSDDEANICELCNPVKELDFSIEKLVLNMTNYEGEDIFHTYESGMRTYLSQRFVEFVEQNGLTNLSCVKVEDFFT